MDLGKLGDGKEGTHLFRFEYSDLHYVKGPIGVWIIDDKDYDYK